MAAGDWGKGVTVRPGLINVTFDNEGKINHVGVGYGVFSRTGEKIRDSGWTWGHEAKDEHQPASKDIKALQRVLDIFTDHLAQHEGVTIDWTKGT